MRNTSCGFKDFFVGLRGSYGVVERARDGDSDVMSYTQALDLCYLKQVVTFLSFIFLTYKIRIKMFILQGCKDQMRNICESTSEVHMLCSQKKYKMLF